MRKAPIVLGTAAAILVIYVIAASFITVYQMKSAAEQRDGEALSEHIDFVSVRQSLKDQLNVMMAKTIAEDEDMKDSPLAAFAGKMVEGMVDAFVTPAGITQLMAGEKMEGGDSPDVTEPPGREPFADALMSYESLNKFVVKVKNDDGDDARFILRRRGLGWQLTDIAAPMK